MLIIENQTIHQNFHFSSNSQASLAAPTIPALKGCHTQAKSYDELIERIKEAIELCLEMENQDFEPLEFVAGQRITINS